MPTVARVLMVLAAAALLGGCANGGPARPSRLTAAGAHAPTPPSPVPTSPLPATAHSRTGWSPVAFGAAEVSVPSSWAVVDTGAECGRFKGMVVIGRVAVRQEAGCAHARDLVTMTAVPGGRVPRGGAARARRARVNGIPAVVTATRAGRVVRALGVRISARGPLAARVLGTLSRSPLSVVLAVKSGGRIPAGWRHVTFGGLAFAVPAAWRVSRVSAWGGCPGNIAPGVLELSSARTLFPPSCPFPPTTAGYLAGAPGMVVGAGPWVPRVYPGASCRTQEGLRICVDPVPGTAGDPGHGPGILTAQVYLPHRARPDQVEIGLTGGGLTPAGIFRSIRPSAS